MPNHRIMQVRPPSPAYAFVDLARRAPWTAGRSVEHTSGTGSTRRDGSRASPRRGGRHLSPWLGPHPICPSYGPVPPNLIAGTISRHSAPRPRAVRAAPPAVGRRRSFDHLRGSGAPQSPGHPPTTRLPSAARTPRAPSPALASAPGHACPGPGTSLPATARKRVAPAEVV